MLRCRDQYHGHRKISVNQNAERKSLNATGKMQTRELHPDAELRRNRTEADRRGTMPRIVTGVMCANLIKRYGDLVAVDQLSFEVARGECFGLLGPNGAGKTTTIEILEGLLEPDAGDVQILGLTWRGHDRELRQRIGVQLQETQLAEKLTVEETLRLFRSFYHRGRTIDELLRLV